MPIPFPLQDSKDIGIGPGVCRPPSSFKHHKKMEGDPACDYPPPPSNTTRLWKGVQHVPTPIAPYLTII
jgi:hypothetical protein